MQDTTQSPARGQWASCTYQKLVIRDGVGVRIYSVDPSAPFRTRPEPEQLAGTTRGKVVGFSSASAQRLRRLLFTLDYHPEECFGMAFTSAPWVKRNPEDAFQALAYEVKRCKGLRCAVWRKEVTKKGTPHYHAIVWAKSPEDVFQVWTWLASHWVGHLLRDGVCPGVAFLSGSKAFRRYEKGAGWIVPAGNPDSWQWFARQALLGINLAFDRRPGRSSNFVDMGKTSAVQYLCDHTSKHKAYQAKTTGRAWGCWHRGRLPALDLPGVSLEECPLRLLADIRKALSRMSRYWWPDSSAPFGYRWSRPRRFTSGDKVLFRSGAPVAIRRLVDAARTDASVRLDRTPHRAAAAHEQREGQPAAGEERRA